MANFGQLAAEIISLVWGTPGNFNGFRDLAALLHGTLVVGVSQTATLNRGRHLYSAGRPSRWALAHISSLFYCSQRLRFVTRFNKPMIDWCFDYGERSLTFPVLTKLMNISYTNNLSESFSGAWHEWLLAVLKSPYLFFIVCLISLNKLRMRASNRTRFAQKASQLEKTVRMPEHLRETDADFQSANTGVHSAWKKAADRVFGVGSSTRLRSK